MDPIGYSLQTFGCKVNTYDSGLLQNRLSRSGFLTCDSTNDSTKLHILNTCAVTEEATKRVIETDSSNKVSRSRLYGDSDRLWSPGGYRVFVNHPGVDLIVANSHKDSSKKLLRNT